MPNQKTDPNAPQSRPQALPEVPSGRVDVSTVGDYGASIPDPAATPRPIPPDATAAEALTMPPIMAATDMPDPKGTRFRVVHHAVGPYAQGEVVAAEKLVPVPLDRDNKEVADAGRLRAEGVKRLADLGAIVAEPDAG